VVGVYFPAQLIVQLTFFLGGRDADPGPNGTLLGIWGLLWAWAAWAGNGTGGRKEEGRAALLGTVGSGVAAGR